MAFLEVRNVHKYFGQNHVLRGIDFDLEEGQVLSVIGSSGNGKTTLLRCLNLLETPSEGRISVAGKTVFDKNATYTERELRQARLHFGMVFQNFNLFPQYTVRKNLLLAAELLEREARGVKRLPDDAREELEERARTLLSTVGLSDKSGAYPCELSGGQMQRAAIARALMLSPDVLCFDEPTSALDPALTFEVLRVIRSLKDAGRTLIVVTHEMAFAKSVSDRVIFLSGGVIEESGTPAEVFDHPSTAATRAFLQKESELSRE